MRTNYSIFHLLFITTLVTADKQAKRHSRRRLKAEGTKPPSNEPSLKPTSNWDCGDSIAPSSSPTLLNPKAPKKTKCRRPTTKPSTSSSPSSSPSISSKPSISFPPSESPTVTDRPTISSAPSVNPSSKPSQSHPSYVPSLRPTLNEVFTLNLPVELAFPPQMNITTARDFMNHTENLVEKAEEKFDAIVVSVIENTNSGDTREVFMQRRMNTALTVQSTSIDNIGNIDCPSQLSSDYGCVKMEVVTSIFMSIVSGDSSTIENLKGEIKDEIVTLLSEANLVDGAIMSVDGGWENLSASPSTSPEVRLVPSERHRNDIVFINWSLGVIIVGMLIWGYVAGTREKQSKEFASEDVTYKKLPFPISTPTTTNQDLNETLDQEESEGDRTVNNVSEEELYPHDEYVVDEKEDEHDEEKAKESTKQFADMTQTDERSPSKALLEDYSVEPSLHENDEEQAEESTKQVADTTQTDERSLFKALIEDYSVEPSMDQKEDEKDEEQAKESIKQVANTTHTDEMSASKALQEDTERDGNEMNNRGHNLQEFECTEHNGANISTSTIKVVKCNEERVSEEDLIRQTDVECQSDLVTETAYPIINDLDEMQKELEEENF